jgi:hypothetical protein
MAHPVKVRYAVFDAELNIPTTAHAAAENAALPEFLRQGRGLAQEIERCCIKILYGKWHGGKTVIASGRTIALMPEKTKEEEILEFAGSIRKISIAIFPILAAMITLARVGGLVIVHSPAVCTTTAGAPAGQLGA